MASQAHPPIPHLPAWPLLGNIFALRRKRLQLLSAISRQFGDIGAFHFGTHLVPLLNSPELVRSALLDQATAFEKTATVRALAAPILGNGVFLSEGELHHHQRKMLAPLFQHRRLLDYAEDIVKNTARMQEQWREGETINIAEEMMRLTVWIISNILFGADVFGEEAALGEALLSTFRHFTEKITNPFHLPQNWPTPGNRRARQALGRVNASIYRMIEERGQRAQERHDLLSAMLHAQDQDQRTGSSAQYIRDEALSLFVAGHETTANALTWCWYLLSQHPDISARMQAEGDKILAGRLPTPADLPQMPYTLQIFKEALRLYPPVYAFTRRALAPVELGTYLIPEGTSVVISPYTLQRRSRFFPDPERFDPERFAPEQEQQMERYVYLPFGMGSHSCLGMQFAQLEGQLILATLAQHFTFEFRGRKPLEPEPLLTLRPKGSVLMKIHRR